MSCRLLAAVLRSMHNRRARVSHPALQLMSCLSFVRGEGHTLWLEGSHPFCEVLSLSATGGLLSLVSEKREGTPLGFYASAPALSSDVIGSARIAAADSA